MVQEIIEALEDLGDPERREMSTTYYPTSMRVIGVSNPEIKAVIGALRGRFKSWSDREWIELSKALVSTGIFECQMVAFEIISRNKKLLGALTRAELEVLGKNLDNWASVDLYSVGIYGVLWGKGVVRDQDIHRLLESSNHWDRRVAVVSTVALNLKSRGGTGDTLRTLAVCEKVAGDRHDMIQKALSWALRELSKRDRDAVVAFMERHGTELAGRVVREVTHKLEFGTKN